MEITQEVEGGHPHVIRWNGTSTATQGPSPVSTTASTYSPTRPQSTAPHHSNAWLIGVAYGVEAGREQVSAAGTFSTSHHSGKYDSKFREGNMVDTGLAMLEPGRCTSSRSSSIPSGEPTRPRSTTARKNSPPPTCTSAAANRQVCRAALRRLCYGDRRRSCVLRSDSD